MESNDEITNSKFINQDDEIDNLKHNQYYNEMIDEDNNVNGKELIYNEDSGFQNIERLFDDQSQESAVYEIEFKIFDKTNKNVL